MRRYARACATAAGWSPEPEARVSTGILVVAAQRDLRRNVFDALDGVATSDIDPLLDDFEKRYIRRRS